VLNWLWDNREWVFSGIGVAILIGLAKLIQDLFERGRAIGGTIAGRARHCVPKNADDKRPRNEKRTVARTHTEYKDEILVFLASRPRAFISPRRISWRVDLPLARIDVYLSELKRAAYVTKVFGDYQITSEGKQYLVKRGFL
jgi:hypothetical protein